MINFHSGLRISLSPQNSGGGLRPLVPTLPADTFQQATALARQRGDISQRRPPDAEATTVGIHLDELDTQTGPGLEEVGADVEGWGSPSSADMPDADDHAIDAFLRSHESYPLARERTERPTAKFPSPFVFHTSAFMHSLSFSGVPKDAFCNIVAGATVLAGQKSTAFLKTLVKQLGVAMRGSSWVYYGDSMGQVFDIGRFYFALEASHAIDFVRATQQIYDQAHGLGKGPLQYKVRNDPAEYGRADAALAYFTAPHQAWHYCEFVRMARAHPEWFGTRTPHFVAAVTDWAGVVPGLGFAMQPPTGGSFGHVISEAFNKTQADLMRTLTTGCPVTMVDLLTLLAGHAKKAGLDLEHPGFFEHTEEGQRGLEIFDFMAKHSK